MTTPDQNEARREAIQSLGDVISELPGILHPYNTATAVYAAGWRPPLSTPEASDDEREARNAARRMLSRALDGRLLDEVEAMMWATGYRRSPVPADTPTIACAVNRGGEPCPGYPHPTQADTPSEPMQMNPHQCVTAACAYPEPHDHGFACGPACPCGEGMQARPTPPEAVEAVVDALRKHAQSWTVKTGQWNHERGDLLNRAADLLTAREGLASREVLTEDITRFLLAVFGQPVAWTADELGTEHEEVAVVGHARKIAEALTARFVALAAVPADEETDCPSVWLANYPVGKSAQYNGTHVCALPKGHGGPHVESRHGWRWSISHDPIPA